MTTAATRMLSAGQINFRLLRFAMTLTGRILTLGVFIFCAYRLLWPILSMCLALPTATLDATPNPSSSFFDALVTTRPRRLKADRPTAEPVEIFAKKNVRRALNAHAYECIELAVFDKARRERLLTRNLDEESMALMIAWTAPGIVHAWD